MQEITSRDNQRLKIVRKVRDGRIKDSVFIEGVRLVFEALRSDLEFSEVFISENFFASNENAEILSKLEESKVDIFLISNKLFDSISDTKSPQGIILTAKLSSDGKDRIESMLASKGNKQTIIILLHEINNPSNLGAILRTAEAADALGIITTVSSANVFSPKAVRGAMGASFRLPVWENVDFQEIIEWANSHRLTTICADINAEKSYTEIDWNQNYLLIFGSEAHGLSEIERNQIDKKIFIPMENGVESLNLAVACGIILFEAKKSVRK